jgi:hypothetical protein
MTWNAAGAVGIGFVGVFGAIVVGFVPIFTIPVVLVGYGALGIGTVVTGFTVDVIKNALKK